MVVWSRHSLVVVVFACRGRLSTAYRGDQHKRVWILVLRDCYACFNLWGREVRGNVKVARFSVLPGFYIHRVERGYCMVLSF